MMGDFLAQQGARYSAGGDPVRAAAYHDRALAARQAAPSATSPLVP